MSKTASDERQERCNGSGGRAKKLSQSLFSKLTTRNRFFLRIVTTTNKGRDLQNGAYRGETRRAGGWGGVSSPGTTTTATAVLLQRFKST